MIELARTELTMPRWARSVSPTRCSSGASGGTLATTGSKRQDSSELTLALAMSTGPLSSTVSQVHAGRKQKISSIGAVDQTAGTGAAQQPA